MTAGQAAASRVTWCPSAFELGDEAAGGAFGVAAAEVVAAEVAVELAGCEHVPAGAEDRVLDGAERASVAAAGPEALVLRGEVDVVGAGRRRARLRRARCRATWSRCGCCRSGVCRRTGRCRGTGRPSWRGARRTGRRLMSVPISAMIDLGGAPLHAGDRAEQLNRRRERGELLLDRVGEPLDLLVEEVEVGEDRPIRSARAGGRSGRRAPPCSAGSFARSLPLRELGEHLRVGRAGDERVEHRAAGDAEDVGGDAVELDPGVLERSCAAGWPPAGARRSAPCGSGSGCAAPGSAWAARSCAQQPRLQGARRRARLPVRRGR